jgi:hypothetical protein
METIVCGATAYQYWRVPPIVTYLAAAPEADPSLRRFCGQDELIGFRAQLHEQLPFLQQCTGASWRNFGENTSNVRDACMILAPSANFPVETLVTRRCDRGGSSLLKPSLWTGELPRGATTDATDNLCVTTPAFTLLQLASRLGLTRTVLLASELCGCYAVYDAPAAIKQQLQRLANRGRLKSFHGWRPCLDASGQVGNLWSREPLVTPDDLTDMAERASGHNGSAILREAAKLVIPLAASPFETQAGILLAFSKRKGGEGFEGLSHNEKVELSRDARLVGQRQCCYCDIYWPDGLDVECQSAQYHNSLDGFLSDADRTAALKLMGVNVLPLTYAQFKDPKRFDAFCDAVADSLNVRRKPKTESQAKASEHLRGEIMVDWAALPYQNSGLCMA